VAESSTAGSLVKSAPTSSPATFEYSASICPAAPVTEFAGTGRHRPPVELELHKLLEQGVERTRVRLDRHMRACVLCNRDELGEAAAARKVGRHVDFAAYVAFTRALATRANLQWCLRGIIYADPPPDLLRHPRVGDYAILVPPPSKADPYGEVWGAPPKCLRTPQGRKVGSPAGARLPPEFLKGVRNQNHTPSLWPPAGASESAEG
jgi:hypothetical protein